MRASSVGLGLAVLSAATFGSSGTFGDSLMASGWTPGMAVLVRISVAAVLLTVPGVYALKGRWATLRRSAGPVIAFGLVAVAGCQLAYFNAVHHLSVSVALLLEYSSTVLVVLWMWLRHRQRPRGLTIGGTVLAVGGLALVLDVTGSQHVDGVGIVWGLVAAAGGATYFVLCAHSDNDLPALALAWAGMVIGAVALGLAGLVHAVPMHANTNDVDLAGHRTSWIVPVLGISLVAAAIAYGLGIAATRLLGARLAAFVGLAEVLFAVLFAWILLDQRPTLLQDVGGLVVLAGIALVHTDERDPSPAIAELDALTTEAEPVP